MNAGQCPSHFGPIHMIRKEFRARAGLLSSLEFVISLHTLIFR